MMRTPSWVVLGLATGLVFCSATVAATEPGDANAFSVVDASIPEIRDALAEGRVTSRELVAEYLQRIGRYELQLNATQAVNDAALSVADRLDAERQAGQLRGPLHGIPIALKDNIHTTDMPTTGGAVAFEGFVPPYDATIVENLRAAGAIILAKTTLTELANWVATGMPDNYNALRGYGLNPYDPRRDPRQGLDDGRPVLSTGGSSSGIGTAVSFWAGNIGTQTSGSLLIPSNNTMLVGLDPTLGRLSRHGIIPITMDQDSAGPMTRTVAGAALLLGAMESPAGTNDPHDPAVGVCEPPAGRDYTSFLDVDALDGARIGIPRAFYYEPVTPPGADAPRGGLSPAAKAVMDEAIAVLRERGAVIVDPAVIPSQVAENPEDNQLLFGNCFDTQVRGRDNDCSVVMKYGMKRDFNGWLASLGASAPVSSLTALREFNRAHSQRNAIKYNQQQLDFSDEMDVARDRDRYEADRAKDLRLTRTEGIDAALEADRLDALLIPSWAGEQLGDKAGYPQIIVPFGTVPQAQTPPLPPGFDPAPMPFGVSFLGTACSEPGLIALAYAFEQATQRRVPPPAFP